MGALYTYAKHEGRPLGLVIEFRENGTVLLHDRKVIAREHLNFSSVEVAHFDVTSLPSAPGKLFELMPDGDNSVRINNVPIFMTYNAPEGSDRPSVTEKDLDQVVMNFYALKGASSELGAEYGWLPKLHVGHNEKGQPQKPVCGFCDNLRRVGKYLFCDYRFMDKWFAEDLMKRGTYPDRSCELDVKNFRLLSVALLGGSSPYHKLPQMRRFEETEPLSVAYTEDTADTVSQVIKEFREETKMDFASIIINYCAADGIKYTGDPANLQKFMTDNFKDSATKLFELLKEMVKKIKTQQMNSGGAAGQYSVDEATVINYVCSEAARSTVVVDTATSPTRGQSGGGSPIVNPDHNGLPPSLGGSYSEQVAALSNKLDSALEVLKKYEQAFQRQGAELDTVRKERVEERKAAKRDRYRNRLTDLGRAGCPVVSAGSLDSHIGVLMNYGDDDTAVQKYFADLDAIPKMPKDRRIVGIGPADTGNSNVVKYDEEIKASPVVRAQLHNLGLDAKTAAQVFAFCDVMENDAQQIMEV